jgi:hypothetical protein
MDILEEIRKMLEDKFRKLTISPSQIQPTTPLIDVLTQLGYTRGSSAAPGGGITDAPSDSVYYGRRNAAWVNIKTYFDSLYQAAGSYLTDAPSDGSYYGRLNAAWTNLKTYFDTIYSPLSHGSHIPVAGSSTQLLQWASTAVAKWVTMSGDATIADGGAIAVNKTRLNVRNETGVTIATTKAVYSSGFNNLPLIILADNTDEAKHNVIGVTVGDIAHQANGYIATAGQCDAETNAWVVGTELYLSTTGALTSTEPTSGSVQHVGIVTVQANYPTGKLLIFLQPEGNTLAAGASTNAVIRMGDSAGSTKVSFRDYANVEVASVNSDGAFTAVSFNGLTAAQVTDLTDSGETTLHAHAPSSITGTAVITTDSRLSDARTPTAHVHSYQPIGQTVLANDTLAQALATNTNTKLTVTAARTLTTTVPAAGIRCSVMILTSGVSSFTVTFGTGFKPTGTLATGTVTARVFVVNFISDGTNLYEAGRTAAMAA